MSLQVMVKSTDPDLTTTGFMKAQLLGATATSTVNDVVWSNSIRAASRWAETYIGQPLTVQTYREAVAGFGRRTLRLSRTPILAVKAVYDATDTGEATQIRTSEFILEDADAGLLARDRGFEWTPTQMMRMGAAAYGGDAVPLDFFPAPGQEYKPFLVDYVAGWTYGGIDTGSANWSTEKGTTSTGRTLPEDVEQAVMMKAINLFEDDEDVAQERLGDLQVTYNFQSTQADTPTVYKQLLEPYVRLVP